MLRRERATTCTLRRPVWRLSDVAIFVFIAAELGA
jgi:hypothetical protein